MEGGVKTRQLTDKRLGWDPHHHREDRDPRERERERPKRKKSKNQNPGSDTEQYSEAGWLAS